MRWLSYRIFTALGWRIRGELPDLPKMVVIGAPHTSNWDFFIFLAVIYHFDIRVRFLAKHTLFRRPFGWMFRKVGGIPVDRAERGGVIDQVRDAFKREERMILVIAPEGTRKAADSWKSGFLKIAQVSHVPIVFAGVDSATRTVHIGPAEEVGPDPHEFMDRVRAFYADMDGLRPEGKGPMRLDSEPVLS
jgi:1-acyl-sn-glycerol-3-phosphate acyltransferase